jgi:DNA-binding response OmpR family regulator
MRSHLFEEPAAVRIVMVDRDIDHADTVSAALLDQGFAVMLTLDADHGLDYLLRTKAHMLLVNLPTSGVTSLDLCRRIRQYHMSAPLVFLGGSTHGFEEVLLLEAGADDYLVKPYSTRELVARIRSIIRRYATTPAEILSFGEITVYPEERTVVRSGRDVPMTPLEFDLLLFLMCNRDCILTRERILHFVWGHEQLIATRTLDVHIAKLRRKLEREPECPRHLISVHGVGYRFAAG